MARRIPRSERRRIFELRGFIDAFETMTAALEYTRQEAAPKFRKALDEWADQTTTAAVRNLNRPEWLLSRSMSHVVREYKADGKMWAMSGVTKDGEGNRAPSYYVAFHESGWRPFGKWKPSAPKRFLNRAYQETKPILQAKIDEANAGILKSFREMVEKKNNRF